MEIYLTKFILSIILGVIIILIVMSKIPRFRIFIMVSIASLFITYLIIDYSYILDVIEKLKIIVSLIILNATLTILTFTYSMSMASVNKSKNSKEIFKIGERFFMSTLFFIIFGVIFLMAHYLFGILGSFKIFGYILIFLYVFIITLFFIQAFRELMIFLKKKVYLYSK